MVCIACYTFILIAVNSSSLIVFNSIISMLSKQYCFLHVLSPVVDCGDPGTPTNGQRTLFSTTYNTGVYYTCNEGYTLQGPQIRTCWSTGLWSERLPVCTGGTLIVHLVL